jgi:hypothetical protein
VGGVFAGAPDLRRSHGVAFGSMARSMSFTDHNCRPSAVMKGATRFGHVGQVDAEQLRHARKGCGDRPYDRVDSTT